jgi:hypothetical protein
VCNQSKLRFRSVVELGTQSSAFRHHPDTDTPLSLSLLPISPWLHWQAAIKRDPVVDRVLDVKTEEIGPGEYRYKAEIDFNGSVVVDSYLNRRGRHQLYVALRAAAAAGDDRALDTVMIHYGAPP